MTFLRVLLYTFFSVKLIERFRRKASNHQLEGETRLNVLKLELQLLQGTFNKYDDLIYRNRNWFITLWSGVVIGGFTLEMPILPFVAMGISGFYFFLEGLIRYQSVFKYTSRYRTLRSEFNRIPFEPYRIALYDLTDHIKRTEMNFGDKILYTFRRVWDSFFRLGTLIFYFLMGLLAYVAYLYLTSTTKPIIENSFV